MAWRYGRPDASAPPQVVKKQSDVAFLPVNGDHAIQQVTFSVLVDQTITAADLNRLRSVHRRFRDELPAVGNTQVFVPMEHGTNSPQKIVASPGMEFSYMRPDSTPAWKLRIGGGEVAVDCFRYTRWEKTWERAFRYFLIALEVLSKPDPEREFKNFVFVVIDTFKAESTDDSPRGLIRENSRFAADLFSVGPLWHQHTGWFTEIDPGRSKLLTQLNIATTNQHLIDDSTPNELYLHIHHVQTWMLEAPIPLRAEVGDGLTHLSQAMRTMHNNNKAIIVGLLEPSILERIGLSAGQP